MNKFFLDAAYAIALSAVTDQYHRKAEFLARQIETEAIPLITTRAVILEMGNNRLHIFRGNARLWVNKSPYYR